MLASARSPPAACGEERCAPSPSVRPGVVCGRWPVIAMSLAVVGQPWGTTTGAARLTRCGVPGLPSDGGNAAVAGCCSGSRCANGGGRGSACGSS